MTHAPIETDRLRLVMPQVDHLPRYATYCASDRSRFVGGPYDPVKAFEKLCAMSGHWALRGFGRYVMTEKDTGQPIGHVGALQLDSAEPPEMTWTIWDGAFEGKGYAFEAVRAYLSHASGVIGADQMIIRIVPDNHRSLSLAQRFGAERDDTALPPAWMPDAVTFRIRLSR